MALCGPVWSVTAAVTVAVAVADAVAAAVVVLQEHATPTKHAKCRVLALKGRLFAGRAMPNQGLILMLGTPFSGYLSVRTLYLIYPSFSILALSRQK